MSDLALTPLLDLDLSQDRAAIVDGPDAIAQKIGIRLRFFLGEWFLDERVGIPYYQQVLRKNPNLVIVEGLFRRTIASTPGVEEITAFSFTVDAASRTATLEFSARVSSGEIISQSQEFIL